MTDKGFIELIRGNGNRPTSDIIKTLLSDRNRRQTEQYNLYERYRTSAEGVPIKTRVYKIDGKIQGKKINNRLNNDFFGDIINVKVGFFAGIPFGYLLDYKTESSEAEYEGGMEAIKNFHRTEAIEDLDAEMVKIASICGEAGRMLYIGKPDGEPHIVNLFPWEFVVLYEGTNPVYGFYIYEVEDTKALAFGLIKTTSRKTIVEFYDNKSRVEYESVNGGDFALKGEAIHGFDGCPVYSIFNNAEAQGDGEKVLSLIDAYDRLLSDWDNEIEQFRLAYMAILGGKFESSQIEAAHATGAISAPEGVSVDFITKDMNVEAIDKLLDRIEDNIYQFAQSINSRDEAFAGTITGVALSHKMNPLDQKCLVMERKISTALRHQFKLLCEIWKTKRVATINYLDVTFKFKRKYPQNLEAEAEIATKLRGTVSLTTILHNLSIVEDVEEELQRLAEETEVTLDTAAETDDQTDEDTVDDEG